MEQGTTPDIDEEGLFGARLCSMLLGSRLVDT